MSFADRLAITDLLYRYAELMDAPGPRLLRW
ncbi:Uncharacterised protein [Mycobacteroides abscessus subsp. abscessus]|nr:Uncharacterised protein [Mycobacteroides abscessus subsp. abscessus]